MLLIDDSLPDEINLATNKTGSAKRIRAGRRMVTRIIPRNRPLWRLQLSGHKAHKRKRGAP